MLTGVGENPLIKCRVFALSENKQMLGSRETGRDKCTKSILHIKSSAQRLLSSLIRQHDPDGNSACKPLQ